MSVGKITDEPFAFMRGEGYATTITLGNHDLTFAGGVCIGYAGPATAGKPVGLDGTEGPNARYVTFLKAPVFDAVLRKAFAGEGR